MSDRAIETAARIVTAAAKPVCRTFFDERTNTATHVVHDPATRRAAIVDSVLDYDPVAGRTSHAAAALVEDYVRAEGLEIEWILETHLHADHLSAAPWLQGRLGGRIGIGGDIVHAQEMFGRVFNAGTEFVRDGSQFDHLFRDGDLFSVGGIEAIALHVPGHTSVDMAFVIGDLVVVGDTLFMPDSGTARADFPGGDARTLYRSARRLLSLPGEARLMICHDYKGAGRAAFAWETSVAEQRATNLHVRDGITEDAFVEMRQARDATLGLPRLMLPSVQVNMRGGHLPELPDGRRYLTIPVDVV